MVAESKKKLEILIEKIPAKRNANPKLEQHVTPSWIAADIIWISRQMNLVSNKIILDLGSGTGRLCIGALLAGAKECVSIEIDIEALEEQKKYLEMFDIEDSVHQILADATMAPLRDSCCETALMNPPFGTTVKGLDIKFLYEAVRCCKHVMSLHLSNRKSQDYIRSKLEKLGCKVRVLKTYKMELKQIFEYHVSRIKRIPVDLFYAEKVKKDE